MDVDDNYGFNPSTMFAIYFVKKFDGNKGDICASRI